MNGFHFKVSKFQLMLKRHSSEISNKTFFPPNKVVDALALKIGIEKEEFDGKIAVGWLTHFHIFYT
jgi:hypothetical protein